MASTAEAPIGSTASSSGRRPALRAALTASTFAVPAFALYALFVVWPMAQVVWLGLHEWNGYGPQRWVGLGNVASLAADDSFRTAALHSLMWDAGAVVLPTTLGLALAIVVRRARGSRLVLPLLFFPVLLPPSAVAVIAVLILSPLSGLLNSLLRAAGLGILAANWLGDAHLALPALFGVWLWSVVGVSVLLLYAGLTAIGPEFGEIAALEGAGALWKLAHITIPAMRRTLGIVALLNVALAAQVFDLIFVTTGGGPGYATITLPLDMYARAFNGRTGEGAAVGAMQVLSAAALAAVAFLLLARRSESFQTGEPEMHDGAGGWAATIPAAVAAVVVTLPLAWLLFAAVEPGRAFALGSNTPIVDPRSWTADNLWAVWNTGMSSAVVRSGSIALAVVAATLCLAAPATFALARLPLPRAVRVGSAACLVIGLLQPGPVLIIPLFSLLRALGLLQSDWGIVLPEIARALPLAILVLWAWLAGAPRDILEAAEVDGASPLQQMLRVALPLARPALLTVSVWAFMTSWNEYLLPTVVSQDGSLQTVPTVLASYIGTYNTQFGPLAAGAAIAIAPSILLFLALRRPAARGLRPAESSLQ